MTARTRCGWFNCRECDELLLETWLVLRLTGAVYWSYVRPAILCGGGVRCLSDSCCLRRGLF